MSNNDKLEAAKAAIQAATTVEEVKAAKEDYDRAVAEQALAEEKRGVMAALAPAGERKADGAKPEPRTIGEFAAKNLDLEGLRGKRGTASTGFGFKVAGDPMKDVTLTTTSTSVVDVKPRPLTVRDLFGAETVSGNALQYYVMGATAGVPAVTAELAAKPQVSIAYSAVTMALDKIACFFRESDELLEDAAFLVSAINNRGIYEHNLAVEKYLVSKLTGTSGIQSKAFKDSAQDSIFGAMTDIQVATGYTADAVVINPADYQALRLAKDANDQYYGGGFFYGAYANGGVSQQPGIWGLPTVVCPNVEAGTAIVGAFKAAGSVVTKAGSGLRVEVSNSNEDDFTKNAVTCRIEERLGLAVRVPAAFAKVALSA